MTTVNIVASDTLMVYGRDAAVFATARASAYVVDDTNYYVGQHGNGGPFYVYRAFLKFDTSTINARAVINSVKLQLTATADDSTADFDIQIVKQNWSAQEPVTDVPVSAIALRAVGARAKVASGDLTPGEPAGAALNDILICVLTQEDNVAATMSADWTQIYAVPNGATMQATAWWCRRGSSAPSYVITRTGGDSGIACVLAFQNCVTAGSPINVYGTELSAASATITIPTINVSDTNCMMIAIAHADDNGTCALFGGTNPIYVEAVDDNTDLGLDCGIAVDTGINTVGGTVVTQTATYSLSANHVGAVIVLTPINTMEPAYDNCLAGTADAAIWRNTSGMALNTPYQSGELSTSWITKGGTTYYSLRSSKDFAGTTPITLERITIAKEDHATAAYRPTLIIAYRDPTPQISII